MATGVTGKFIGIVVVFFLIMTLPPSLAYDRLDISFGAYMALNVLCTVIVLAIFVYMVYKDVPKGVWRLKSEEGRSNRDQIRPRR